MRVKQGRKETMVVAGSWWEVEIFEQWGYKTILDSEKNDFF